MTTERTWRTRSRRLLGACAFSALVAFTACNENGAVPPSLIGVIEPKPSPTSGTDDPAPKPTSTDVSGLYSGPAEIAPYVAKFVDDARLQGRDVTGEMLGPKLQVRIASLDSYGSSVIGLCETSSSLRRVTFDPDFWNAVSETQRELLAHHEFGHCVLYRGHRSTVLSSGIFASVMYPTIMKSTTYLNNYDYYQDELFTYAASEAAPEDDPARITVHVCDHQDLGMAEKEGEE
jgi:hypothetical protein